VTIKRVLFFRAPDKFNSDARNLAYAWNKWKEELNLYIDLTMDDDNEPAKVKLFLYLIRCSSADV
jgi:uncharacterized protein YxjI